MNRTDVFFILAVLLTILVVVASTYLLTNARGECVRWETRWQPIMIGKVTSLTPIRVCVERERD